MATDKLIDGNRITDTDPLPVSGTVALDAAALAALENITVALPVGQTTAAQSTPVVLASDAVPVVAGTMVSVTATFTREGNATPYTAGDVVSDLAAGTNPMAFANFARVVGGSGYIVGARLSHEIKSITPRFRVHLYNATTITVAGDNLPHKHVYADVSKRIGWFDLPAMTTGADTTNSDESRSLDFTIRVPFVAAAATRTIYVVLETLDAFTPGNAKGVSLTLLGDLN